MATNPASAYPSVSLADAREKCDEARKLVKQGINPVQNRQVERIKREQDSANTFEVVAKEWLALKDWEEVTKRRRLDMLQRVVFPAIGKLPVRQITPAHILDILSKTAKRGAPTVAAEAKRTMSGIFELAVATLRADNDPVWPVRKALPANKTQHKTALASEQIGKLLNDFDNHRCGYQVNFCIQLMWWTLARPSEAAEAEWVEFDLDKALWCIPARRMKARREHVVPLPKQAVEMLRRLRAISGDKTHLFPGRDDRNKPMSAHSIRQALKVLGWSGTYSPHGTRTTGSTRLNEMGYRPDAIEAQLAHAEPKNGGSATDAPPDASRIRALEKAASDARRLRAALNSLEEKDAASLDSNCQQTIPLSTRILVLEELQHDAAALAKVIKGEQKEIARLRRKRAAAHLVKTLCGFGISCRTRNDHDVDDRNVTPAMCCVMFSMLEAKAVELSWSTTTSVIKLGLRTLEERVASSYLWDSTPRSRWKM